MRHALVEFPTSRNTHIAEEIMLSFRGVVRGRVLCGGLRDKNTYEHDADEYTYEHDADEYLARLRMSREKWFTPLERLSGASCKKCLDRHHRAMDLYEREFEGTESVKPSGVKFTLAANECVLNRAANCIRTDKAHKESVLDTPEGKRDWFCPTHD